MSVALFLHGTGVDNNSRTFAEVMSHDDNWFEVEHDYIQWLFPLLEESNNVHDAPVLTITELTLIKGDAIALENQTKALERMVQFYTKNNHWLVPMDHNHLRITRILKSVRLLQSLEVAEAFYNLMMERVRKAGNPVKVRNVEYWTDAVGLSYSH
jgi:Opioid growth factor receptor (OGFr) conserved region